MRIASSTLCPRCGSPSVEIVFGLPGVELFEQAQRGEVALGGCMVISDGPTRECSDVECGLRF